MEQEDHQLLNIIFITGLVIIIATTIALPTLSWKGDYQKEVVVKKEEIVKQKTNPKRLTFSY